MKSSWKTTVAGISAILIAIGTAATAWSDGNASTVPDWGTVVTALIVGLGLIFARDNNVTSEKAGAS